MGIAKGIAKREDSDKDEAFGGDWGFRI